jgi:hypothetical protein
MGDSESGRGALYADVKEIGGYDHFLIDEPFSPEKYVRAIKFMEDNGAAVGVIDSFSHEWEGPGGVCDLAAQAEERSGVPGLHNWNKPKQAHKLVMLAMLRAKIPLIVCLRAKFKTRQARENGKTKIVKDDYTSPLQSEDFLFECTIHGEVLPNHAFHLTKSSHPDLKKCFPVDQPLEIKHGQLVAKWCSGSMDIPAPAQKRTLDEVKTDAQRLADLKKELWKLLENILMGAHGEKGVKIVNQYCWDEIGMDPNQFVQMMNAEELSVIVDKVRRKQSK